MRKQREANKNWDNMNSDGPMSIEDKADKNWLKKTRKFWVVLCFLGCFALKSITIKFNSREKRNAALDVWKKFRTVVIHFN
jgi:hypothetical protein